MKPKPNVFPLKKQKARSISRELTGGLIFTVLIVSTIAISAGYFRASRNAGALLENKAEQYITSLTNILPVPLWNYDRETVQGIAAFYAQNEFVSKLEITDSEGNVFFKTDKGDTSAISIKKTVMNEDNLAGHVYMSLTSRSYKEINQQILMSITFTILINIFFLIIMTSFFLRLILKKPLRDFSEFVDSYDSSKYDFPIRQVPFVEFHPFVSLLNKMGDKITHQIRQSRQAEKTLKKHKGHLEQLVNERTAELTSANEKLTVTVKELKNRTNEILLLNQMGNLMLACDSEAETYDLVARICHKLFPSDAGYLYILDDSKKIMKAAASWGNIPDDKMEFELNQCWAIRRGNIHLVMDPHLDPLCPHLNTIPDCGCVCAPMIAQGKVLGMMHLCMEPGKTCLSDKKREYMIESGQMLIISILERYASCITNLRLRVSLKKQSMLDPLTGLYNRRYMEESFKREAYRAERKKTSMGIIMLDVDHFKSFNDNYGHKTGDIILGKLGAYLMSHVRREDLVCRYGGEEFTIILPDSSLNDTRKRAEQLRKGIKEVLQIMHNEKTLSVTVSLGVSAFPKHGHTHGEALIAADAALYRAKAEGRDRVEVAMS